MIANFSERKTGNVLADMKFAIIVEGKSGTGMISLYSGIHCSCSQLKFVLYLVSIILVYSFTGT